MANYFYTDLKQMGLTDALIKAFVDPPDNTAPNPKSDSYPWMKMYDCERVDAIMSTGAFVQAFAEIEAKRRRRKTASPI